MSRAINNAPQYLTGTEVDEKSKRHKNPKNVVSGVGYGGLALAKGIVFGITGLVTEPYKGAKEKGAKGAAVGVGKGLIGLVAKPIGGAVGLVGCSVQGAVSTPGTIKKAVTKKEKKGGDDGNSSEEEKRSEGMEFDMQQQIDEVEAAQDQIIETEEGT